MAGLNPFDTTLEEIEDEEQQQRGPKPNPFLETLEELDGAGETQMRGSMKAAQATKPDTRAEALRLREITGLPVDTIERNIDDIRKRAKIAETPYSRMMAESPVLSDWVKEPDNAAVAQDDLEQLGALEWLFTAPQRAFSQGINQVRYGKLKAESMFRTLSREEQDLLESYRHHMELGGENGAGNSWWRGAVTGASRLLPNIGAGGWSALKYGTVGALEVGVIGGVGGSVIPGAGTVAGATGGAALGFKAGALYGGAKFGFELEAGLALDEYEQFRDEAGRPLDPDVARAAALATGVLNAGLEAYGLTKLAGSIPGLDKLTGAGMRKGVKEALRRPTVRAALLEAVRSYGGVLTAETATEVAQRAATILSGEVAKIASGQEINPMAPGEIFEDLLREGVGAVQSFGLVAAPGPVMQLAVDRQRAAVAERNTEIFNAIAQGVTESKTFERAPRSLEGLISRAVENGPIPFVYAPVDTWTQYFQDAGVDPAEIAAAVTGNPQALRDAESAGGLIKIPTENYAVRLAPTDHGAFLAEELKFAPEEMNAREAKAFKEAEVARAKEQQQARELSTVENIEAQLTERITSAGVPGQTAAPLAKLMTRGFALAESVGVDPAPLFDRYGITVQRPTSTEAAAPPAAPAAVLPAGEATLPLEEPGAVDETQIPVPESYDLAELGGAQAAAITPAAAGTTAQPETVQSGEIKMKVRPTTRPASSPVMRRLAEEMIAKQAAVRGTAADIPDNPVAQSLERERLAALAAWQATQQVDAGGQTADTSDSQVGGADGGNTQAGERRQDDDGERAPADVGGADEGAGDGAGAQRRWLPTKFEIDDVTAYPDGFVKATKEADEARLTPGVRRELERIAEELDTFQFVEKTWNWLGAEDRKTGNAAGGDADIVAGAAGAPVYDDILTYAPLNAGKKADLAKAVSATRAKVEADVRKVLKTGVIHNNIAEGAVRVAERRDADDYRDITRPELPPTWGVEATPELVAELSDAIDTALEDADASFDVSEFDQSMRSLFDAVDDEQPSDLFADVAGKVAERRRLAAELAEPGTPVLLTHPDGRTALAGPDMSKPGAFRWTRFENGEPIGHTEAKTLEQAIAEALREGFAPEQVDTLDTGEQQPRLPGAGAVRDQSIETPEFEAPFALTPTVDKSKKGKQTTLFQSSTPNLLATHNLSAANLLHADRMGGLAVPSLAITRKGETFDRFGEITLLAPSDIADPAKGAQVFGADVYSPRYPTVHYSLDAKAEKTVQKIFRDNPEGGQLYIDWDSLVKEGPRYLETSGPVMAQFLKAEGVDLPAPVMHKPEKRGKVTIAGGVDQFGTRYQLEAIIREQKLEDKFKAYAGELFASLEPKEKIFRGFTNQGNRSYKPHTLENVVAILKKELRGGESNSNLYGMGQLRARYTPRFRSLGAIRKAEKTLIGSGFEKVKEEVEKEFFAIVEAVKPYYGHSDRDRFGFSDTVIAVMEDAPRKGLTGALKEYSFEDVPADVQTMIGDFLTKLRTLPTEYFEVKQLRAMGLEEFAAAVVPEDASPDVLAVLEKHGIPVTTYKRGDEADRRKAVEAAADNTPATLFQERRGAITIGPDRRMTISLFESADLSTFLHETGHFYLELMGDLVDITAKVPEADRTPAQARLLADWSTLLEQLGAGERTALTRDHHERFARMFETYLMEGKAPSVELQAIFSKFRAWLLGVYRSLRALRADLTPEVRGVFDRMLATDEEIAAAEARGRFEQMFATPEAAGMTPAEFAVYQTTAQQAHETARERLEAKLLGEVQREQTEAWRARRAEIEAEVAALAHQAPVYRALAAMRYGENPDGTSLLEGMEVPPLKLSRQMIVDRYGADRLARLPRPYIYTRTGGVDPELVAERFGFSSGDELIAAIEQAEPMAQAIKRETDRRMLEEHGSMLLDGSVVEEAQAAASNEIREEVLRLELQALWRKAQQVRPFVQQARRAGADALAAERREREYERRWLEAEARLRIKIAEGAKQVEIDALRDEVRQLKARARGGAAAIRRGIPDADTIRQAAEQRIAKTIVRDINPALYWNAARKAAAQALDFAARQEFDDAVLAKTEELLNVALYREAEKARADVTKRVARAKDLGKPKTQGRLGLAGGTFLEQILGILDRYNFATVSRKELDKRARMRDWMEAQEAQGLDVSDLPAEVQDDLRRADYQMISYEELVGVSDGLDQLVHLARLKTRTMKTEAGEAYSEVRDGLVESIRKNNKRTAQPLEFDAEADRRYSVADWFASHTKIATLARMLDGNVDGGPFWDTIIRPLNRAQDLEQQRRTAEGETYRKLLEQHYPGGELSGLKTKVYIPAIGGSLSKEARLAVALNWGNETSRQRLLSDVTRKWTKPGIEAILDTLDENDWRFVQATWDNINRFWPEIAEKQQRLTGLAPAKVEPAIVVTKFGEFPGGYYPLMYDGRLVARAGANEAAAEAKLATAAAYVSMTTRRGHTIVRLQNVKSSVRLDLGVAFQHIDQVIHDLTHHETLIDVTRLIRDPKVSAAIYETRGPAVHQQFVRALQDIALGTGMGPTRASVMDKAANFMRSGTQLALMGWNLWTGAQQPLGLFNGMERVGVKWVARGMHRWLRDAASMESTTKWIAEVSPFMAERTNNATQDIADVRQRISKPGGWFDNLLRTVTSDAVTAQTIIDSYLWHIGMMQRVADVPTWLGAYEKAVAGGADGERAVALADQAVRDSQGSGQIVDLAQVQRGTPVAKLFLTFYSYGNTVYNRTAATVDEFRAHGSVSALLGHLSLLYVMPAFGTVLLSNLLGRSDEDDGADWILAVGGEMLASALNTMVLARELSSAFGEGNRGYAGPAGTRAFQTAYQLATQVKQGEPDEALFKALNNVAGVLLRYPAGQVQRTVDGFVALQEGKTHNPLALLFGAPRE